MATCPCINCICVPVCRLKSYTHMMNDCSLVVTFIDSHNWGDAPHLPYYRGHIKDAISPAKWDVDEHGNFRDAEGDPIYEP